MDPLNTFKVYPLTMWSGYIKLVLFISALIAGGITGVAKGDEDFIDQQKMTSHLIVDMFLLNVDQGKLEIFGHIIKRSQIHEEQVAYVHNLEDDSLSITIYLSLNEPVLVPHFTDFHVDAISIDIDKDGNILQVKSHLVPDEK